MCQGVHLRSGSLYRSVPPLPHLYFPRPLWVLFLTCTPDALWLHSRYWNSHLPCNHLIPPHLSPPLCTSFPHQPLIDTPEWIYCSLASSSRLPCASCLWVPAICICIWPAPVLFLWAVLDLRASWSVACLPAWPPCPFGWLCLFRPPSWCRPMPASRFCEPLEVTLGDTSLNCLPAFVCFWSSPCLYSLAVRLWQCYHAVGAMILQPLSMTITVLPLKDLIICIAGMTIHFTWIGGEITPFHVWESPYISLWWQVLNKNSRRWHKAFPSL